MSAKIEDAKTAVVMAFEDEFFSLPAKKGILSAAYRHILAAVRSGWISGVSEKELDDMPPKEILSLFDHWYKAYEEVTTVDPN